MNPTGRYNFVNVLESDSGMWAGGVPSLKRAAAKASLVCFTNETTSHSSHLGTSISGTRVDPNLIVEFRETPILSGVIPTKQLQKGSLTAAWPTLSTTVSLSAITSGTAEADAVTPSALTTAAPSATAASKAAAVVVSWLSDFGSEVDWKTAVPQILGRAAADLHEVDACSLLSAHVNTVGTSGIDNSLDILRQASVLLRTNALGAAAGGAAFYLHDQQIADVDAELVAGSGTGLSPVVARQDVVNWYGAEPGSGMLQNYRGPLFGMPVFQSTKVPLANGSADRGGALVVPSLAYRKVVAWDPRTDFNSQAVNIQLADSYLVSCAYAYVEVKDLAGVSVITDA